MVLRSDLYSRRIWYIAVKSAAKTSKTLSMCISALKSLKLTPKLTNCPNFWHFTYEVLAKSI